MQPRKAIALTAAAATVIAVAATANASPGERHQPGNKNHEVERAVDTALKGKPKNVIFLIGDGMGTQEITAARYYQGVQQAS